MLTIMEEIKEIIIMIIPPEFQLFDRGEEIITRADLFLYFLVGNVIQF